MLAPVPKVLGSDITTHPESSFRAILIYITMFGWYLHVPYRRLAARVPNPHQSCPPIVPTKRANHNTVSLGHMRNTLT